MTAAALVVAALLSGARGLLTQASPVPVTAPGTTLAGTLVAASTSAPIADALVTIVEPALTVRTGADGRFVFRGIAPGTYTLTVSTIGYIFVRRQLDIVAGTPVDLTIPLAEGTGTYEETVNVSAALPREPASTTTELNSSALQDLRGVLGDDPVRAVQALPGVATGNDFAAEFSVRGAAPRNVGTVIDDTATPLLFHTVHGTEDIGSVAMINTDVLDRASLSIGAHPQRHGDWLSATLDFGVREGSRDRTALRLAVSGTNTSGVIEGPLGSGKRGSWLVSLRKSYVEWLIRKIEPDVDSTIGFTDGQSKLVYDLTARQQVQLVIIGGDAIYSKPSATTANDIKRAVSKSVLASAVWRYTGSRVVFSSRLSFVTNRFENTGAQAQEEARGHTDALVWRTDFSIPLGSNWMVEAGSKTEGQGMFQTLRNFALQANAPKLRVEQSFDNSRRISGGWAQLAHQATSGTVTAGVRTSYDTFTGSTVVSPWLMGERTFGNVRLSASTGGSNQFPGLDTLGEAGGPVHPEHANMLDLGLGQQLTSTIRWRITGFYRRESNILRPVSEDRLVNGARVVAGTFPTFSSNLAGRSRGVDVILERHASSGLTGWIGYTWSHTRERDVASGEQFDADFDQRHTFNAFVEQRLSYRMLVSAKLRMGSNMPLVGYFSGTPDALVLGTTRNAVRLPFYARLDLDGRRTFTFSRRRLTLFVELMNVLGRRNLAQFDGTIRSNLTATGFTQRLIPFVPSAGMLLEF